MECLYVSHFAYGRSGAIHGFINFVRSIVVPQRCKVTSKVYFDIAIHAKKLARSSSVSLATMCLRPLKNFRALCTGEKGKGKSGKPLHYKGSVFHRVIPQFMLQGGDFTNGNGTGGESIYGEKFADENFKFKHEGEGILSMANAGPGTNGSQFFITTIETPWLNGKTRLFGKVVEGMDVVKRIEALGSDSGRTRAIITIADCGEVK